MLKKIIYFDGFCGLCNGWVDFVLSVDTKKLIKFSPLQSTYAKHHVPEALRKIDTIIYDDGHCQHIKSTAVLHILKDLGGLWQICFVFILVPAFFRHMVYDVVALIRYRLFGKRESCRLPNDDEKDFFILS